MTKKHSKNIIIILLILQSLTFAILKSYYLDKEYAKHFGNIVSNNKEISLNNIDRSDNEKVGNFINAYLNENNAMMFRYEQSLDYTDEKIIHTMWMAGDYENQKDNLKLEFLDNKYASNHSFDQLIKEGGTIGLYQGHSDLIEPTPKFILGDSYVFLNLIAMGKNTSFNGNYNVIGLEDKDIDNLYKGISEITGLGTDDLKNIQGGSSRMSGMSYLNFIIIYAILSIVLIGLLASYTTSYLKDMGTYLLLGWSKNNYINKIYADINKVALIQPLVFLIYGLILSLASFLSIKYFAVFFLAGLFNTAIFLLLEFIISLILRTVNPINAIHGRVSKKGLLAFGIVLYLLVSIAISTVSFLDMDGMIAEVNNNIIRKREWENVSDYYVPTVWYKGNDLFDEQTGEIENLSEDTFRFYKSIEDEEGVKLVHSSFFSREFNEMFRDETDIYNKAPDFSFVYMVANKNHLVDDMGIEITDEMVKLSKDGYRVYLLPKTYTDEMKDDIEDHLEIYDKSLRDASNDFTGNEIKGIKYFTYDNDREYFVFPDNYPDERFIEQFPVKSSDPVILLAAADNMSFFEADSLTAGGEYNSYIKLDDVAYKKFINADYLAKFNLDDNKPELIKIKDLIGGMIRSLSQRIGTFILIALLMAGVCILILFTLINLYREIFNEIVNIKKFLGYSNFNIYKPLWLIIIIASSINIGLGIINGSLSGSIISIFIFILQALMMNMLIKRNQFDHLTEFLK